MLLKTIGHLLSPCGVSQDNGTPLKPKALKRPHLVKGKCDYRRHETAADIM